MSATLAATTRQLILDSTARVVESARHVVINDTAVLDLSTRLLDHADRLSGTPDPWEEDSHLFDSPEEHAQFLFALDALNFSFFPDPGRPRWHWPHAPESPCADPCPPHDHARSGAIAFGDSLRHALRRGTPVTDAAFLARVTTPDLRRMLGGENELPMLDERRRILNEVGSVLLARYNGRVSNLLALAEGSADRALKLITRDFPNFRDVSRLDGADVILLKRAQIFISDLWHVFGGAGPGAFHDADSLTAFPDYRLPQVLRSLGVLEYDPALASKVDTLTPLAPGSREEIEIRAATVQAAESLRLQLSTDSGLEIITCRLDGLLWWLSHQPELPDPAPYHLCRTTHY